MKNLILSIALVAITSFVSSCGGAANTNTNNTNVNKSTTAIGTTPAPSVSPTAAPSATKAAATPAPPAKGDAGEVEGELQAGKSESVIMYVGEESGDYAAYCFANDSDAGKAIMAACKNGEQCKVVGTIDGTAKCKVPGLEADLSDSGRITAVKSARSLGKKK
ncbi:MAG TPA: hypothetical protein PKA82_05795 [Pyrinomonadaceae bacterium]|nr:hypothetical protein [Pyrinomonadaceae bacterium]